MTSVEKKTLSIIEYFNRQKVCATNLGFHTRYVPPKGHAEQHKYITRSKSSSDIL